MGIDLKKPLGNAKKNATCTSKIKQNDVISCIDENISDLISGL